MPWLKKAAEAPTKDKIWELSDSLYRLYDASLHYCARELTDGHIAASRISPLTPKPATKQQIEALVKRRLWHRLPDACPSCLRWRQSKEAGPLPSGGYLVHDYLEFNPSRAQWTRRQQGFQEGGRKGAEARWHSDADGSGHDLGHDSTYGVGDRSGHEGSSVEPDGLPHRSTHRVKDGPYSVPRTPSRSDEVPGAHDPEPDIPERPLGTARSGSRGTPLRSVSAAVARVEADVTGRARAAR